MRSMSSGHRTVSENAEGDPTPTPTKPQFSLLQPRWAMALAAIPLVVIAVSLMQPDTPSASEIAQARQEMAIAFAYLDKAGVITGREIESTVGHTMADAVTGSVNKSHPITEFKLQGERSMKRLL